MTTEVFVPIAGYGDKYMVGNQGTIKSFAKSKQGQVLKPCIFKTPRSRLAYRTVSLTKNGKSKSYLIHRIVAKAFIPNTDSKRTVNHKDGDSANNAVINLEWATDRENILHARTTIHKNGYTWTRELCKKGHRMVISNLFLRRYTDGSNYPYLVCRICKRNSYKPYSELKRRKLMTAFSGART